MNELMARHNHKHTAIAAAVMILAMGTALQAQAQAQQTDTPQEGGMQTVVVTGVRAALEQSLRQKRNADSVVEVVTAEEDIIFSLPKELRAELKKAGDESRSLGGRRR